MNSSMRSRNEQGSGVTVDIDGLAIDKFHHEVRRSILEVAAVYQACDGGIVERRQDVALHCAIGLAQARMHRRMLQDLDGNGLTILRIIALAAVHRAHGRHGRETDTIR